MIKLTGSTLDGKDVLILGLEQGNWDRLLQGKPIHLVLPGELGISWEGELLIIGAETQQDMVHELSRMGVLKDVPMHTFNEAKEQP